MVNERPKGSIYPKQHLEIVQIHEEKAYGTGGKTLLPLNAKNLSLPDGDPLVGKSLKHTIFNPELKEWVKTQAVGARFLADIEERERPDKPDYGPDRTIVQIYVQGEPVSKKKGGGSWGKSPEIVRLEHELDLELEGVKRRSIEGQTAIAQVGALIAVPGTFEPFGIDKEAWLRILGKYWRAVEKGLDNYLAEPKKTQAAKPPQDTAPKPVQKPQETKLAVDKSAEVSKDTPPTANPIKHVGDLLTRANKKGLNPAAVAEILGVSEVKNIGNLNEAWSKIEKHLAEKEAEKQPAGTSPVEKASPNNLEPDKLF
jgi:hypothetical protein